jgi:hydroxyacylglutathione hydrolase
VVTDHVRGDEPWFVLTGDALLIGDAGRPDLHAHGEHTVEEMARTLYRSLTERLLTLPDHLALFPAHYSGSVCGRGLSANPISTIGFERRNNPALCFDSEDAFVAALLQDIPPAPAQQAAIVAANRAGRPLVASA